MTPFRKMLSVCYGIVARVRYRLDNFFTRGVTAQFTILFVLMIGLILSGTIGLRLGLYDSSNKDVASVGHKMGEGFWDAVWWSTMHIFDPSYVSQDYGATTAIIILGLVISMLGLVLFGGVIGLVSAGVERKLDELSAGNRPVVESGHLLILGWNHKIFSVLDLFEGYHKPVKVVILAHHPIAEMLSMLQQGRSRPKRIKPVVRSGSPTQLAELERVAFRQAYSIIVLADESHANQHEEPDLCTIKTLMLLAGNLPAGPARPKIVAELLQRENLEVAHIASQRSISLICSSEVLSRMIVQSSRQPGLTHVYNELFGFAGSEIYIQPHPHCAGRPFGDLMFEFPEAVVIGTSTLEPGHGRPSFSPRLNPGKDHVVGPDEWLILLGDDSRIVHRPDPSVQGQTEFVIIGTARDKIRERVLILGWNSHIFNILQEYDTFLNAGSEITVASLYAPEKARARLDETLSRPLANAAISCVHLDYTIASRLDTLLEAGPGTCIILADESSEESDPDSRTIVTILLIRDFEARHPEKRPRQIVAEILSVENAELLQSHNNHTDIIVSPRLVSMLLAQVSQQLMLENIYSELMNAHGNEIYLRPAGRYTRRLAGCTFTDVVRGASKLGELAIGLKIHADASNPARNFGVKINPPKETPLSLSEKDEVIVISFGGRNLLPFQPLPKETQT
jgi:hypothetical protein